MDKNNLLETLRQQLVEFGLNPKQWSILYENIHSIKITNGNLRLSGKACGKKMQWLDISWENTDC